MSWQIPTFQKGPREQGSSPLFSKKKKKFHFFLPRTASPFVGEGTPSIPNKTLGYCTNKLYYSRYLSCNPARERERPPAPFPLFYFYLPPCLSGDKWVGSGRTG
ncbi:unnamed protein product [Linum tenue]|uniref:Uncharacterized protein n=1 Tax=Linum tenue TaxID=586396 RepID=A0AAV0RAK7_9ROSI|nr:unnamed protein product [Linum tenue]